MVIGVERAQLQGLLDAVRLLESARIDVPVAAYLFARFRPDAYEQLRSHFVDRITTHFEGMTGVDEAEAQRRATTLPIFSIGLRVRLTPEALAQILGEGLLLHLSQGIISMGNRGNVPIRIHQGVGATLTPTAMTDLALVHRHESLEAYLFRFRLGQVSLG